MRVIAIELGFYGGSRRRVGAEFEMAIAKGAKLPRWVVLASSESRAKIVSDGEAKRKQDLAAIIAAAGPKRDGKPGARPTNTGLADATAEPEPGKAVGPSWYPSSPVEAAIGVAIGVVPVAAPEPAGAALPDLA